jgi:hypothetical protein
VNYRVRLAPSIEAFIREKLSPACRVQVTKRLLVELPQDPDGLLVERVPPLADVYTFPVVASDPTTHPYKWWFVFYVRRRDDGFLDVESAREATPSEEN